MAEAGEQGAQVLEGLSIRGVRTEKEGEFLPRDWSGAMHGKVSQQVLETRMIKAGDRLVTLAQAKLAEQI